MSVFQRQSNNHQIPDIPETSEVLEDSPTRRSRSPQVNDRSVGEVTTPESEAQESTVNRVAHNVEIEEVSESDEHVTGGPEPVITEQEEVPETPHIERTEMFTEITTVIIKELI